MSSLRQSGQLQGKRVRLGLEGILDPFASGLLIVGLGTATRFFEYMHTLTKTYEATLKLGVETDTLDPEGAIVAEAAERELDPAELLPGDLRGDGKLHPRRAIKRILSVLLQRSSRNAATASAHCSGI